MSSEKSKNSQKEMKNAVIGGTLYLVATPIGNLSDISERALKVMREVDFIAAEDTRNSGKLLSHFGISKPMVSYFEHNKRQRGEYIVSRIESGESCALITDAGTPAISDPGEDIVKLCSEKNIPVTSIPGACAVITALTLSALPTGRFAFDGFLSTTKSERRKHIDSLKSETRTIILYEAPHKLKATLSDLLTGLGNRKISLCRELTKLNEEVLRFDIKSAVEYYKQNEPRGEYVLIIEGADKKDAEPDSFWSSMTVSEHVEFYINEKNLSKMDAIKATSKDRSVPKSEVYRKVNVE